MLTCHYILFKRSMNNEFKNYWPFWLLKSFTARWEQIKVKTSVIIASLMHWLGSNSKMIIGRHERKTFMKQIHDRIMDYEIINPTNVDWLLMHEDQNYNLWMIKERKSDPSRRYYDPRRASDDAFSFSQRSTWGAKIYDTGESGSFW